MRDKILAISAAAAFAGFAALSSAPAFAVSCGSSAGLDTTNIVLTNLNGDAVSIAATDCAGNFLGNDIGAQGTLLANLNDNDIFGGYAEDDWELFGDTSYTPTAGDPSKGGTFSVDFAPDAFSVFALSLKGSDRYAVYLFDVSPVLAQLIGGDYKMTGIVNNGSQIADLSHLTSAVYSAAVIPLPAALPMFLAALGGLGILGWRRRAAVA